MSRYTAIYVGDEFPEYTGTKVEVWDNHDQPNFPCYSMSLDGQEIDNMHDEDFEDLTEIDETREIKFRAKAMSGEWVYGNFIHSKRFAGCGNEFRIHNSETGLESDVDPETVGQFTGLKDKNGVEIFEGDVIEYKDPYRTTQTHYGDNIPNGAYTEPMEPGIRADGGAVYFKDGAFGFDNDNNDFFELCWLPVQVDMQYIKDRIEYSRWDADLFDDPEEGDLPYLIEISGVSTPEELITLFSGCLIVGNIHDNHDLI